MTTDNKTYEFLKVIVFSTAHISKEDDDKLRTGTTEVVAYEYEFGYWIHIPSDAFEFKDMLTNMKRTGFTDGFIKLFKIANEQKCQFLRLDCDGPEHDELQKYEWE